MRANDIHMSASIDEKNRVILVTGAIDRNDHTIVLKVPVPSRGEWTVIKAEVNITEEPWIAWQMNLGEGTSIIEKENQPELLMSKNFKNTRYLRDRNTVIFYSDGKVQPEVRPGDAILKYAKVNIASEFFIASHNRRTAYDEEDKAVNEMLRKGEFGKKFPKVEVVAAVTKINEPDTIN
ncbi:DUF6423 family protein [Bacillus subtilis]|uniref:DUF6423 family protein n=1 Tax=Bacillus subtilis TaxID=1423 RepID=UPI001D086E46|nr:DUF6423 family protein [Bacillus subtilis]MCB7159973.1 DUF6423 family protein [Bacillus subtilis]MCB7459029.1 DUF6423 family protein [Bacillus subtilis]